MGEKRRSPYDRSAATSGLKPTVTEGAIDASKLTPQQQFARQLALDQIALRNRRSTTTSIPVTELEPEKPEPRKKSMKEILADQARRNKEIHGDRD